MLTPEITAESAPEVTPVSDAVSHALETLVRARLALLSLPSEVVGTTLTRYGHEVECRMRHEGRHASFHISFEKEGVGRVRFVKGATDGGFEGFFDEFWSAFGPADAELVLPVRAAHLRYWLTHQHTRFSDGGVLRTWKAAD